jgi:hypothetical protein
MSFILDALKKSESERHRHSGPVLMDVRIAPPRRRLPTWAWVIAGVLLVNLLLLVWLLWLAPHRAPATAVPVSAAVVPPTSPAAPPVAQSAAAPASTTLALAPPVALPPVTMTQNPPAAATSAPALSAAAPAPTTPAGAGPTGETPLIDIASVPKVHDLIAAGAALPELRLSLHVYDPVAAHRYILLNGTRLREGEFTPDGLQLLQITPGGAVLEWRGRRMFLAAGG